MKNMINNFVAAAVLCSLPFASTEAAGLGGVKTFPKDTKVMTAPAKGGVKTFPNNTDIMTAPDGIKKFPRNTEDFVAGPAIKKFSARRDGARTLITAVITNMSSAANDNVIYAISKHDGKGWVELTRGTTAMAGNSDRDVSWEVGPTNASFRLKFDVISTKPANNVSKQIVVGERRMQWVVRYNTTRSLLAFERDAEVDPNKLRGADARKHAAKLQELGFATRVETKVTHHIFHDSERSVVWANVPSELVRTFSNRAEAESFRQSMTKLLIDPSGLIVKVNEEEL